MEKEDLMSYRHKLGALSEEESRLRDEYLVKMHLGEIDGPLVGDVFVDKPWLTRYSNNQKANFNLKNNVYQTYLDMVQDKLDEIAVYVYDSKQSYTHRQIIDMVEKASSGLILQRLTPDSKVGVMLNGSVEEVITFLALQKIGVTAKYIDYMKSVSAIKHNLVEADLDLLIADECFAPLLTGIDELNSKIVIANTEKKYDDEKMMSFDTLYEIGKEFKSETVPYEEGKVSLVINSSGTTGHPKQINHTSYSINAAAQKILQTDFTLSDGNVMVKTIPSQIGLGLITSMYIGLISGCQTVLVGGFSVEELINKLKKFVVDFDEYKAKYNMSNDSKLNIFAAPKFFRDLILDENVTDLSNVGSMLAAGSKMSKEELDELCIKLKEKGCNVPICNGYGQNEMAGAVSLNNNTYNQNGSAGYPTYQTDVIVVDKDTHELLSPGEEGLILERSKSLFKDYENLKEETLNSRITLSDGSTWFNSHDLGYMDEDGFLYITGRTTRVVIRYDFKISLDEVERKIRENGKVKDCATINSKPGGSVEEITAFIELNGDYDKDEVIYEINTSESISEYERPTNIVFIEKIPYMDNGKIDYMLLKNLYNQKKNEESGLSKK